MTGTMRFLAALLLLALHGNAVLASESVTPSDLAAIAAAEDRRAEGRDELVAALADPRVELRDRAVLALSRLQDRTTVPDLLPLLGKGAASTRRLAAFALGQIGDTLALGALGKALASDTDPGTRLAAAEALGKLGDPRAVPMLRAGLANAAVRGECLLAFARAGRTGIGDPLADVASRCASYLTDASPDVRWKAAYALERLYTSEPAPTDAPKGAVEALLAATADGDPLVRTFVARAIGRTAHGRGSAIVARLRPLLADPDWRVRVEAARALGRVGGGEAANALCDYLAAPEQRAFGDTPAAWHPEAAALEALVDVSKEMRDDTWMKRTARTVEPYLTHDTPGMRWRAAAAMFAVEGAGSRGDSVLVTGSWLPAVLEDEDWTVRSRVAASLGAAKKDVALPLLVGRLADSEREPKELGGLAEGLVATGSAGALPLLDNLVKSSPDPVAAAIAAEGIADLADSARVSIEVQNLSELYVFHPDPAWSDARSSAVAAAAKLHAKARDAATRERVISMLRIALRDHDAEVAARASEELAKLDPGGVESSRQAAAEGMKAAPKPVAATEPGGGAGADVIPFGESSRYRSATIHTSRGDIEIGFAGGAFEAPLTVRNFVTLAERGWYDGIRFHRVVPDFVIQAGCPRGDGWGGPGYTIRCEYNQRRYGTGAVGMALSGKDTGGSQFFITHSPTPRLDGRYTIFGQVTSGQDVVDDIREGDTITGITIHTE